MSRKVIYADAVCQNERREEDATVKNLIAGILLAILTCGAMFEWAFSANPARGVGDTGPLGLALMIAVTWCLVVGALCLRQK